MVEVRIMGSGDTEMASDDVQWEVREGDCVEVLRGLEAGSVDCCITSPPYYGLRDYGSGTWEGGDPECDHRVGRFESPCSEKQRSNTGSAGHQARSECPK